MRLTKIVSLMATLACITTVRGQVAIHSDQLNGLTYDLFKKHPYGSTLKSKYELSFLTWKPIEGFCSFASKYSFSKECTVLYFDDSGLSIEIKGRRSPYMTEDSIRVGDKVTLSKICKNISDIKAQPFKNQISCNSVHYSYREVLFRRIKTKDKVIRITQIKIYPVH